MVNHIVLWNLNEELTESERKEAALEIKSRLEAIKDAVAGVVLLELQINEADSSNRDIALISKFESWEALQNYQVSPEHVAAGKYVRSVTCNRSCFDYEEK
ncbi:MAG: Dabb family protein [Lachnospiraceae bacterium]|nr:Dabb family protein [Lachnospiraceae bacterium]